MKRPTTGVAHAATWGGDPGALLDWLQVPRRHAVGGDPALDGLVLLDLPDHDSTRLENRLEVDRLVELVDVLVWVMDPQKYADAAVHDRYLKPYVGHAGRAARRAQPGRPAGRARPRWSRDLRGLLDSEGLAKVAVVPVSARTGQGLDALRAELRPRGSTPRGAATSGWRPTSPPRPSALRRSAAGRRRAASSARTSGARSSRPSATPRASRR